MTPPRPAVSTHRRALVVGLGNTLRGDDALGPIVAERIRAQTSEDDVTVLLRHGLQPELVEDVATARAVVLVDVSLDGLSGRVDVRRVHSARRSPAPSTHAWEIDDLVAAAEHLIGDVPPVWIVSTLGLDFDLRDHEPSPPVAALVEPMCEEVLRLIRESTSTCVDPSIPRNQLT